jgi:hypothetical protein
MKGDFSRDTFDRRHRFARVLLQQGRVLLDADWNEQTSILLHYIRSLARDLIGPHGGPDDDGFRIGCTDADGDVLNCDFSIGRGRYYVDGILVETDGPDACAHDVGLPQLRYLTQPDYPDPPEIHHGERCLVYLDVWERHLTHLDVDHIREVALGGPDTATRSQVVWQVKVASEDDCGEPEDRDATCTSLLDGWIRNHHGPRCLRARARVPEGLDDPCIIPPEARYRGAENQLYRVEIHDGGTAGATGEKHAATFKWSRDNGSVVFAIRSLQGAVASLDSLGPDAYRGLEEGDWVEVVDDRSVLHEEPGALTRVAAVDRVAFEVTLDAPASTFAGYHRNPLLRRWDHGSDAIPVHEGKWIDLEDGVQVFFEPLEAGAGYRSGDHWLIPARAATGDVLWPVERAGDGGGEDEGEPRPRALPPNGIVHHYAPLGRITIGPEGRMICDEIEDCRCVFRPLPCERELPDPRPEPPTPPTPPTPPVDEADAERERLAALVRIAEVGERRAEALVAAGHDTPAAVAAMSVDEVRTLLRVNEAVARTIIESAREVAAERV